MGRTRPSRDEDVPPSVLASDAQETCSDEMLACLRELSARWWQEKKVRYAIKSEENKAYSWLFAQVYMVLSTSDELKALRSASEHEDAIIYELQQLRILTQAHLESAATVGYGPEYIQTLQRLRAELILELDEFV